jgi:integrase
MILTERNVASAEVTSGDRLELWDVRTPGLCLRVTRSGVKTWIFRYRTPGGRQPRFTIGQAPAFGLKDARGRAAEIEKAVALGGDPATDRREARNEPAPAPPVEPPTFDEVTTAYFAACASGEWKPKGKRKKPSVIAGEEARYRLHIKPTLGPMVITAIRRRHVKALLRGMIEKGIHAQTNLSQALIRQIFNFAISEMVDEQDDEIVQVNPATGFARLGDQEPRGRIWSDDELRTLWSSLDDQSGLLDEKGSAIHLGEPMSIAIKLLTILAQRRSEVIGMRRAELDLAARIWLIPPKRIKGSRAHLVPLPDMAVDLIKRAMVLADFDREEPSQYVFPTPRSKGETRDNPIMPASVSHAMTRLRVGMKIDDVTIHDLRRTASTNMTSERCGVSPFIRSKVLGHLDAGGGAQVSVLHYDANSYVSEKRAALEAWTKVLCGIIAETPAQA